MLVAIGIDPKGKRSILGVSVSLSEAEVHWRDFLGSLHARGLHGVKLVVSDAQAGLKPALDARLTGVPWQRCQFHTIRAQSRIGPAPSRIATLRPPIGVILRWDRLGGFGRRAA